MGFVIRIIVKVAGWLFGQLLNGGHTPGGGLPGGMQLPPIPKPSNQAAKAKAKALQTENEVLRADAGVDHAARVEELKTQAEVKNEKGRVVALRFPDTSGKS